MADRQTVDPVGRFAPQSFGGAAILLAFSTVAYLLATWCGLGQTPDSQHYIATAQHLAQHGTFTSFDGQPYTLWPPLFPLILSLAPHHPIAFAKLLHLGCLLGTLLIWWKVGTTFFHQSRLRLFFLFTLASSTPLLMVHVFVWSEALFIFLFSAYLLCIHRFLEGKRGAWLFWASVFAFFMMLQRNAGIMLFAGMTLGLVLFAFQKISLHWWRFVGHALGSFSGWTFWQCWQYFLKDHTTSINYFFITEIDPLKYKSFFIAWYTHWFPLDSPGAVFGFTIFVILTLILSRKTAFTPFQKSLWLMIGIYIFLLLVMPFTTHRDAMRYQAIFIPPLFLNILFIIKTHFKKLSGKGQTITFYLLFLWSLYPLVRLIWNALRWNGAFCGSEGFF